MCKSSLYFNKAMLHQACLASAFRTSLACTIVGLTTLFGPTPINDIIAFPALSYLTAILIIRDATLGETLRGCWLALCATIQSTVPAMLSFWCIGPAAKFFSEGTTVFAVALAAFVVVLPAESTTHLMAKRLALGQIVVLYVVAYVREEVRRELLMHPLRVAASTALGVLACVLAMLFPYPRLAYHQVKKNYRLLTNNTSKRLKLLMKAICEQKKDLALTSISHAKSLATSRNKLLQILTNHQNGMRWEIPPIKSFKSYHFNPEDQRLQDIDTTIKGMELALTSIISFPVSILNEDMKHGLNSLVKHVSLTIKQTTHNSHGASLTAPEHSEKNITNFLQSLQTIPTTQDLPFYFYLFCAKILQRISYAEASTSIQEKEENSIESQNWAKLLTSPKLMESMKCSLTLGLAVLLGLLYSKENGFWAAIPVAVTFCPGREATFRVANIKAQGTVLGTVYGALCCFVFEKFLSLRFMFLIPWLIFTTVLQQSKMYGAAGGMSAQIGAILILGRKNFGPPSEFAIARIIETFIGLTCSVLVHLLFMPKRASTCAKSELSFCLGTLVESINSLSLASKSDLEESHGKLKIQIMELKKFVVEAELEPCFWFLPFHGACYNKLMGSLSILDNTLQVGAYALKFLKHEFRRSEASWREHVSVLEGEIGYFKEHVSSKVKVFEQITRMKSFGFLEKELEKNSITCNCDIEMGRSAKSGICMFSSGLGHGDVAEEVIGSYLQCSRNVVDELYGGEGEKEVMSDVYLCLSALGFCLSILLRETMEIEEAIRELVQWENPSKGD